MDRLPRGLRIKKDTSKSPPRQLMMRNLKCEVALGRSRGEEELNELPRLALQAGTNHPISTNQENHVICARCDDKEVSLFSERVWPDSHRHGRLSSRLSGRPELQALAIQVVTAVSIISDAASRAASLPRARSGAWGPATLLASHQLNKTFWGLPRKFPNRRESFSEGL